MTSAMQAGDVAGAVAALQLLMGDEDNGGAWFLLFQLQTVLEDFDGAAAALKRAAELEPQLAAVVEEFMLCLDGERKRAQRRTDAELAGGRGGLGPPPPFGLELARAASLHAAGQHPQAAAVLAGLELPRTAGVMATADGGSIAFETLADADALVGPQLECFALESVIHVPFTDIAHVQFHEPRGFQDVLWVPTELSLRAGEVLRCRVPSQYSGSGVHAEPSVRLGQMTVFDHEHGYALAAGQRDFQASGEGVSMVGIRQVRSITLHRH